MSDATVCGGLLEDGTVCEACEFDICAGWLYTPRARGLWHTPLSEHHKHLPPSRHRVVVDFCPKCGTRLSVSQDGEPVREAMGPQAETVRLTDGLRIACRKLAGERSEFWSEQSGEPVLSGPELDQATGDVMREVMMDVQEEAPDEGRD